MKIGIFGGCFNPPHYMHYQLACKLLSQNVVDKLIIVPTGDQYEKEGLISIEYRVHMLQLLFQGVDNIEISTYENQKEVILTCQTLQYFQSLYPNAEIYYICGGDNILEIETWEGFENIDHHFKVLGVFREGISKIEAQAVCERHEDTIETIELHLLPMSSTYIRKHIQYIDNLISFMPIELVEYIKKQNLYQPLIVENEKNLSNINDNQTIIK